MNETMKTLLERRSVRAYTSEPVDPQLIEQIVQAGQYAASGRGKQSAYFLVITNPELSDHIREENRKIGGWEEGFDPFYGAPVIIAVGADKSIPTHIYDGSLALGNMMLAAKSLGLGTCWIHRAKEEFEEPFFQQLLEGLPKLEGIGFLALGHPAKPDQPAAKRQDNRVRYFQ